MMDDISLTVSLTGGHTHVVGGVSSDLSNTDLVLRIADVLDIDADEVLLLSEVAKGIAYPKALRARTWLKAKPRRIYGAAPLAES